MTRFGIALHETTVSDTLDAIVMAESLDIPMVWLTSMNGDQMMVFALAAERTRKICMGTAIVPIYLRHPILLAQQVAILSAVAPGRFELGIGPSHGPHVEGWYGLPFKAPLGRTREYAQILQQAFEHNKVDFDGQHFHVHVPSIKVSRVPLLISALRPAAFRTAGEVSDGGMSWLCPAPYLREHALPALAEGARTQGRPKPRLVAHCFLAASDHTEEVREDARRRLRFYPTLPFYAKMLEAAGDTEGASGVVSNRLIDSVVVHGSPSQCAARLTNFAQESGADDLIVSLMVAEGERVAGLRKAMEVVAGLQVCV